MSNNRGAIISLPWQKLLGLQFSIAFINTFEWEAVSILSWHFHCEYSLSIIAYLHSYEIHILVFSQIWFCLLHVVDYILSKQYCNLTTMQNIRCFTKYFISQLYIAQYFYYYIIVINIPQAAAKLEESAYYVD